MTIRVLLADDHAIVREGLQMLLEREEDIEVVGEAADGRTAVALAGESDPDVVVMDVAMPDLNGIEAARKLRAEAGDRDRPRVLCLSMHEERKFVEAMLKAGASGYLVKDAVSHELVNAIRTVHAGEVYLSPCIASTVVTQFVGQETDGEKSAFARLSDREREVLQLIAEGYATKEIGAKLSISDRTVAAHREHIMDKLGLGSVAEIVRYAVREGIVKA